MTLAVGAIFFLITIAITALSVHTLGYCTVHLRMHWVFPLNYTL